MNDASPPVADRFRASAKFFREFFFDRVQLSSVLVWGVLSAIFLGAGLALTQPILQLFLRGVPFPSPSGNVAGVASPILQTLLARLISFLPGSLFSQFLALLMVGLGLGCAGRLTRYWHERLVVEIVFGGSRKLRDRVFEHVLSLPYEVGKKRGSSKHLSQIFTDIRLLRESFNLFLKRSAGDGLRGLAALTVAILLDWRLTILALACIPVGAYLFKRFNSIVARASENALEGYEALIGVAQEVLINFAVIKAHGAESHSLSQYSAISRKVETEEKAVGTTMAISRGLAESFMLFLLAALFLLSGWLVLKEGVSPASFLATLVALVYAAQSLGPLVTLSHQITEGNSAALRLSATLRLKPEGDDERYRDKNGSSLSLPRHQREILFENVSFQYPDSTVPALDHVTLKLSFGQLIAVVGPNGAGKSTLAYLIPRLIYPTSGRVLIDGRDISKVSLSDLRNQVALVSQGSLLLRGTIARNIAFNAQRLSLDKIDEALRLAGADEFVRRLPHGLETPLGEFGKGLSAGQRQRLILARALYRNPSILILDEATSEVDAEAQGQIRQLLSGLRGTRTILLISHHLEKFPSGDQLVKLERGRITEVK